MAVDCGQSLTLSGEDFISTYNSSEWAERAFCRNCGSNLYYRLKQNSQYIVCAGLFDQNEFVFDHELFIEEKPKYYNFSENTKKITGEELFAAFSSQN